METLERWIAFLPTAFVEQSSWILYFRALCGLASRHLESQRDLRRAFEMFRGAGDQMGMCLSWAMLIIA
jgi:hypothetical protein